MVDDLAVVVDVLDDRVLEVAGGFLAAAVAAAAVLDLGLLGELAALPTAVEVRRDAPVVEEIGARFFSSSETDGRGRCDTVEAVVEVAGRLVAVVPVAGRVGALFRPPAVLVRVVELVVELVADLAAPGAVVVVPGRRAAEVAVAPVAVVRFGAAAPAVAFLGVATLGEVGDCTGAGSDAGSCVG